MAAEVDLAVERRSEDHIDPTTIAPIPRSPRTHVDSAPLPTDSMVTVRLSEPDLDHSPFNDAESASIGSEATVQLIDEEEARARSSWEIMHGLQTKIEPQVEAQETDPDQEDEVIFSARPKSEPEMESYFVESHYQPDEDPTAQSDRGSLVADSGSFETPQNKAHQRPRSHSTGSESSDSGAVDWQELDKTEESEQRDEASDESTAFLLARLEQENNTLATDPRFGLKSRPRKESRPPSMNMLKKLVNEHPETLTRYSVLPEPPPMTELEFWAALVKDYKSTAQRLPTLTANKIRGGIPPPLRGVVWVSMTGARDADLGDEYDRLCGEKSPYENIIGKDIGRSFPGVEMFRDPEGEGQRMLGRVLKCFSLYEKEIGYCQGLGFLVGPLLMQMGDKDAFCVLVRLMENFDLRSCFLPDLSGLHLRIFQFQRLLNQEMPALAAHLATLQVEAAYLSQWFLSFFAVTCPLPVLFRIYDVIFAEGASETIMRVALSLMRRNEERLMAHTEFEEVMQLLLSRSLWDTYAGDADDMVNDFVNLTGIVTRESLQNLEKAFRETNVEDAVARFPFLPDVSAAASRFLGRIWTTAPTKATTLSPGPANSTSRPTSSILRRSASKQSISTTLDSTDISSEGTDSVRTVTTDATAISRESNADMMSLNSKSDSITSPAAGAVSKEDKDLHIQIEDLLTALSEMQRDQAMLTQQLQKEREERSEDHKLFQSLLEQVKLTPPHTTPKERSERRKTTTYPLPTPTEMNELSPELGELVSKVDERMALHEDKDRSSIFDTKQRLRDSLLRSKGQLQIETSKAAELTKRLDKQEKENVSLKEQLKEARTRVQEGFSEKQKLEKQLQELRRCSMAMTDLAPSPKRTSDAKDNRQSIFNGNGNPGLRELRLGKNDSTSSSKSGHIPKRSTSLATKEILSTKDHTPATEDELLLELVNTKTSEALARQELEEVKAKLDALRKMLGVPSPSQITLPPSAFHKSGESESALSPSPTGTPGPGRPPSNNDRKSPAASSATSASAAAAWNPWGWGKRSLSYATSGIAATTSTAEKT